MELQPGERADRYIVEGLIGTGGMARVYKVRHARLGSEHALKLLTASSHSVRERLLREGQVQSTLRHPNIVPVTDVVDLRGAPALVMDYVAGPTLAELLAARPLTLEQTDALARGLLKGVAAAHAQGLIHRDLKPQNVLLDIQHGTLVPRIADFGLAKVFAGDSAQTATRSGVSMGTPAYMAPEQIRDAATVGPTADVFSLAVLLWELVTGERLFQGKDTMELFEQVCHAERPDPRITVPGLPERMALALESALRTDPAARPADAGALLTLWMGEASEPAPPLVDAEVWDPSTLVAVSSLSSHASLEPVPASMPSGGSDETFGWEGSLGEPSSGGPALLPASAPAPEEEVERGWTLGRQLGYFALGFVFSAPLLLVDLVIVFDSIWAPLLRGGPAMVPILVLGAVTFGWIVRSVAAVWHGEDPRLLSWLVPPALVFFMGELGTLTGASTALQAIDGAAPERVWVLATVASSVALITELSGAIITSIALLATATALSAVQAFRITPLAPSRTHVYGLGLSVFLGMSLWGVALYSGDLGRGPVLVWLATVWATGSCALAASPMPEGGPARARASRVRVAIWFCAVLGTLSAAAAVNGQTALVHFEDLSATDPGQALAAATAYATSLGERPWLPMLAWAAAAGVSGALALSGAARPDLRPRQLLAVVPLLAVVLPMAWLSGMRMDALSGQVLPGMLQNIVHEHTGAWLIDVPAGSDERWSGAGLRSVIDQADLREGELVVVVDSRPVESLAALVAWTAPCMCADKDDSCPLERCLGPGVRLPLTVIGLDGATRETEWRIPEVEPVPGDEPDGDALPASVVRLSLEGDSIVGTRISDGSATSTTLEAWPPDGPALLETERWLAQARLDGATVLELVVPAELAWHELRMLLDPGEELAVPEQVRLDIAGRVVGPFRELVPLAAAEAQGVAPYVVVHVDGGAVPRARAHLGAVARPADLAPGAFPLTGASPPLGPRGEARHALGSASHCWLAGPPTGWEIELTDGLRELELPVDTTVVLDAGADVRASTLAALVAAVQAAGDWPILTRELEDDAPLESPCEAPVDGPVAVTTVLEAASAHP